MIGIFVEDGRSAKHGTKDRTQEEIQSNCDDCGQHRKAVSTGLRVQIQSNYAEDVRAGTSEESKLEQKDFCSRFLLLQVITDKMTNHY